MLYTAIFVFYLPPALRNLHVLLLEVEAESELPQHRVSVGDGLLGHIGGVGEVDFFVGPVQEEL